MLRVVHRLLSSADVRERSVTNFFPRLTAILHYSRILKFCKNCPRQSLFYARICIFGRACSDSELGAYLAALSAGKQRTEIVLEFIDSEEYRNAATSYVPQELQTLISKARLSVVDLAKLALDLSDSQLVIACHLSVQGWLPNRQEFRGALGVLHARGRLAALRSCLHADLVSAIEDKATVLHLFRALENDERFQNPCAHRKSNQSLVNVYFNVDVLCMAISDPRARTGVFRYVSAVARG